MPIWRWFPALFVMAIIFVLSGTPGAELPVFGSLDWLIKEGGHLIGYALLGWSYLHGLGKFSRKTAISACGLAFLYALTDEYHQSFVPGRDSSVLDLGVDALGAALGAWCRWRRAA